MRGFRERDRGSDYNVSMKLLLPFCLGLATVAVAQVPAAKVAVAKAAFETWAKGSVEDREATIKGTVKKLMAAGNPGLAWLSQALRKSDDNKRTDRLLVMVEQVAHRWLIKVEKSEMVYAGQFDDLKVLMPEIGDFYLRLLTKTPQWFPYNERVKVVAPIRDLYPKGPDKIRREAILDMAQDDEEPQSLKVLLAQALAQWGDRKLIKKKLQALQVKARDKDEETAILGLAELAQTYYDIRDYQTAAISHREHITKAEKADYYLAPVNYYNAACCMCLSGDKRSAWDYLLKCLELNDSPRIDSSMRLKRKLFDGDPEIRLLRKDKRFKPLLDKAFADQGAEDKKK